MSGFSVDQGSDSFAAQSMVVHRVCSAFLRNSPRTVWPGDVPYASIEQFSVPSTAWQRNSGKERRARIRRCECRFTLRRLFKLHERLSLQARADFFNIFNHPNFGPPTNYMSSPLFGQSTQMLGASLGSGGQNGGLNPIYQIGGPRSVQLALKLLF
jgi:hypothetical protein